MVVEPLAWQLSLVASRGTTNMMLSQLHQEQLSHQRQRLKNAFVHMHGGGAARMATEFDGITQRNE